MSHPYSLDKDISPEALAWDTVTQVDSGPHYQPWRRVWPPKNLENVSAEVLDAKPWLTWKRDREKPNDKPWYQWVNVVQGEIEQTSCMSGTTCEHCNGTKKGCSACKDGVCCACSTVAEGG